MACIGAVPVPPIRIRSRSAATRRVSHLA